MLKLIKPAKEAQYQVFCDVTGEQLSWCARSGSIERDSRKR